jgi:pimeloyl-ACP methyl ester carboxylesterase
MATIEVNGARLYYEVYGEKLQSAVPVLLIHGSTNTGRSEWAEVALLLAHRYTVIVPDCRGHGQSTNPERSYSFSEMAADAAALVRALGYPRAHVIGHSNGGNVALVTLLEHPDIVQTCIPQAANAFVSPDLLVREPWALDPDRIAREAPAWKEEMIALHGPWHGEGYWRDLLGMTLKEILAGPNYTPADLSQVRRPTFVIQGEADPVNAPAHHAQFMARHIPQAELWIPAGVAHNVHKERTCEWVDRVFAFLARRGDDANDTLYRLRRTQYADERASIFEARVEGGGRLAGQVLTEDQRRVVLAALPAAPAEDDLKVLLSADTPWALVNWAVTDLRREPSRQSERVSQALLGEPLRILEERSDWARVRLVQDGYMGWVQAAALCRCAEATALGYVSAADVTVQAELAEAYLAPTAAAEARAGKAPFGVSLPASAWRDGWVALRLPDGRIWWVMENDVVPWAQRPGPVAAGIAATLNLIRRNAGVPYLWGGRTPFGYDCSGLAQTFLRFLGIAAPRDADQQYRTGAPVEGALQPGDLLFFGEDDGDPVQGELTERFSRITHVAISLGGDLFIHANGSASAVSYNSFDPASPLYRPWLREHFAGGRRFW